MSDEGARHAKVFVKSTYRTGYLYETQLVPETIGPLGAIKEIPFAAQDGARRQGAEPAEAAQGQASWTRCKRLHKLIEEQEKRAREAAAAGPSDGDGRAKESA